MAVTCDCNGYDVLLLQCQSISRNVLFLSCSLVLLEFHHGGFLHQQFSSSPGACKTMPKYGFLSLCAIDSNDTFHKFSCSTPGSRSLSCATSKFSISGSPFYCVLHPDSDIAALKALWKAIFVLKVSHNLSITFFGPLVSNGRLTRPGSWTPRLAKLFAAFSGN